MVECYRQGESPVSSARALWQSYQQSHVVAKQEELAMEMINLALQSMFVHTLKEYFNIPKI
jgi:hypothetical protein